MKTLALFGGAGMLTAIIAGSPAIVLGNLAIMSATVALLGSTLSLDRA